MNRCERVVTAVLDGLCWAIGLSLMAWAVMAVIAGAATIAPLSGAAGVPRSVTCVGGICVIAGQDTAGMAHLWVVSPGTVPSAPPLFGQLSTTIAAGPAAGFLGVALNATATMAVAAVSNQGVEMIDLTNPTQPRVEGTIAVPGLAYALALNPGATTAYVASGAGHLQVISLTDPTHPTIASSLTLAGYELDIALAGNLAYVLNQNGSLHVIDVSGATPVLVRDLALPRFSFHLAVGGQRLAVLSTSTTQSWLDVLDLSAPLNPIVSGSIVTGSIPGGTAVQLVGNIASVVMPWGVQTYDVSTGTPVLVSLPDATLTWIDTGSTYAVGSAPLPLAIAPIPGTPATPIPPVVTPTPSQTAMATVTMTVVATATRSSTATPIPATPTNTVRPTQCSAPPTVCV